MSKRKAPDHSDNPNYDLCDFLTGNSHSKIINFEIQTN